MPVAPASVAHVPPCDGQDARRPSIVAPASSPRHRTFGTSPGKYLIGIRLTAARQLLETTQKSLSEIAQDTGFFDHSRFVKTFQRERGITPGEYRRRHLTPLKTAD